MSRLLAAALVAIVLVVWLALPIVRAYVLVAALPSDPRPPADLAVIEITTPRGVSGWLVRAGAGAPAVVLVHGFM